MHTPLARTTTTNTARTAAAPTFTPHERKCCVGDCNARFWADNPEKFGCSKHRAQAWQQVVGQQLRTQAAAAAAARDLLAAAEGRRDFQRLLEDRAFKAYLDGQKSGTRKGRQVIIVAGPTSITRYLTGAQLEAVEANERAASFAVARLATASAPSN
jgi:hypothetical protein